jgi:Skp family chaperone for outer membrane proteins
MKRTFMYLSALVGLGAMIHLASAQQPAPMGGGTPPPAAGGASGIRPTVAVFNMAAVMRDFEKAKYQVWVLNKQRVGTSGNLAGLRTKAIELKKLFDGTAEPSLKSKYEKDLMEIQHRYQLEERDVNKSLNDEASKIISKLYDEIKMVVDKTAEMNAYHIVFAYPDAVTPEEQANPYLKELKLKPPAAQPFYVSKQVDITGVVIQTLNQWYPPLDEKGQKVDVAKLPAVEPPAAAPGAATPGTPPALPTGGVPMTPGK